MPREKSLWGIHGSERGLDKEGLSAIPFSNGVPNLIAFGWPMVWCLLTNVRAVIYSSPSTLPFHARQKSFDLDTLRTPVVCLRMLARFLPTCANPCSICFFLDGKKHALRSDIEVIHPNAKGGYATLFQRNKAVRTKEKEREEMAQQWLRRNRS